MLKMLRRIVQDVHAAHDFGDALEIMVQSIRDAMETQACSVFLIDPATNEYVLMATDGLNPEAVGHVRAKLGTGLIGLVGEREEPINLENASSHPNFLADPSVGEDRFKALLAAPIIHHRELLGVLLVQQEEMRRFDESEEAFLVTMSAQLAGIIAHADVTGVAAALFSKYRSNHHPAEAVCLEGIAGAPGVGIGTIVLVYPPADLDAVPDRTIKDIDAEIELFNSALEQSRDEIKMLGERLAPNLPEEERALFDVYQRILHSSGIGSEVITEIKTGNWAQGALRKVIKRHVRNFESFEDSYLSERASDIRDLGRRVLSFLQERQQPHQEYFDQVVLVGEEITAAALAEVPEGKLVGVVSVRGSNSSHVAIFARALGVPCVMGVDGFVVSDSAFENQEMIVDGYYGQVYIAPTEELREEFIELARQEKELDTSLSQLQGLPAITPDGHSVALMVNTGLPADAGLSMTVGAEGVGLYRTEIPFMTRERFPAEDEQRVIYRQLLNAFAPRPVIMRTLDIGGDKALPYFPIIEDNPFLGWRGIRLTLDHPEIFLVQVRAMLKASVGLNNLRIMLPMVSIMAELDDALELINQAYEEVCEEGIDIKRPPVGVMIEVPSAVYMIHSIVRRIDFISVGSNDLTQYILAVDRNNSRVANLYDALNPAVLLALQQVTEGAKSFNKPISICGEMASDPAAVILLIAMGFNAFSMTSVSLPRIKWVIRSFTKLRAAELLEEVLMMEDPLHIRQHLELALEQAGLGGLVRGGK